MDAVNNPALCGLLSSLQQQQQQQQQNNTLSALLGLSNSNFSAQALLSLHHQQQQQQQQQQLQQLQLLHQLQNQIAFGDMNAVTPFVLLRNMLQQQQQQQNPLNQFDKQDINMKLLLQYQQQQQQQQQLALLAQTNSSSNTTPPDSPKVSPMVSPVAEQVVREDLNNASIENSGLNQTLLLSILQANPQVLQGNNSLLNVIALAARDNKAALSDTKRRIGVYSVTERAEKIRKFRAKKAEQSKRKKSVKYDCRKVLAEHRPRVRGRFVSTKNSSESVSESSPSNVPTIKEEEVDDDTSESVSSEDPLTESE